MVVRVNWIHLTSFISGGKGRNVLMWQNHVTALTHVGNTGQNLELLASGSVMWLHKSEEQKQKIWRAQGEIWILKMDYSSQKASPESHNFR